jgi:hypothetical protein
MTDTSSNFDTNYGWGAGTTPSWWATPPATAPSPSNIPPQQFPATMAAPYGPAPSMTPAPGPSAQQAAVAAQQQQGMQLTPQQQLLMQYFLSGNRGLGNNIFGRPVQQQMSPQMLQLLMRNMQQPQVQM